MTAHGCLPPGELHSPGKRNMECVGTYIVSMTIPTREMHIAHKRDTGEMGGRGQGCGRVIDLHLPTGREGGRRTRWTLGATPPSTRCRPAHLYGQDQESGCSSHPPRVCSSRFLKVWMWRARRSPRFLIFYVSGEKSTYFRIRPTKLTFFYFIRYAPQLSQRLRCF